MDYPERNLKQEIHQTLGARRVGPFFFLPVVKVFWMLVVSAFPLLFPFLASWHCVKKYHTITKTSGLHHVMSLPYTCFLKYLSPFCRRVKLNSNSKRTSHWVRNGQIEFETDFQLTSKRTSKQTYVWMPTLHFFSFSSCRCRRGPSRRAKRPQAAEATGPRLAASASGHENCFVTCNFDGDRYMQTLWKKWIWLDWQVKAFFAHSFFTILAGALARPAAAAAKTEKQNVKRAGTFGRTSVSILFWHSFRNTKTRLDWIRLD